MPLPPPVRVGVVGCADIAWRRMLPAMAASTVAEVTAVASRCPSKAERFAQAFGAAPVAGYDRLLARADIDAVYVPLPPAVRPPWVQRALRAGKHVLGEKPLAPDGVQATRLAALARRRGLALVENFAFVHHRQQRVAVDLVARGAVGRVRSISAEFGIPPRPADDIRYDPDLGGGALLDLGVYPLRAARLFAGAPLDVAGAVLTRDADRGVDLAGAALLRTGGGVTAHLTFGMTHGYRCRYEVWGAEGRLTVDRAFTAPPDHAPVVRVERAGGARDHRPAADDQFARMLDVFVAAVHDPDLRASHRGHIVRQARLVDRIRVRASTCRT